MDTVLLIYASLHNRKAPAAIMDFVLREAQSKFVSSQMAINNKC